MWGGHQQGALEETPHRSTVPIVLVSCLAKRLHIIDRMSPGGHAATTLVASSATVYLSGSLSLATAVALGGFLIDIDHAVDYLLFNRQWDLHPGKFLRYYLEGRAKRVVLALHSWELFALLAGIAWWTGWLLLWGYLVGAAMHLFLDIVFNGPPRLRRASKVLAAFFKGPSPSN